MVVFRPLDGSKRKALRGGQMILQFEDDPVLGEPQEVNVSRIVRESRIVTGFKQPLPSMAGFSRLLIGKKRELWRGHSNGL